jgi:hypothetical protein
MGEFCAVPARESNQRLNAPAFIRLRRRFAETGLISVRQERLKITVFITHLD